MLGRISTGVNSHHKVESLFKSLARETLLQLFFIGAKAALGLKSASPCGR